METDFAAFLESVPKEEQHNILDLHDLFTKYGCRCDIKTAKSGYLISYVEMKNKKTVANFVFRKTGMKIRMYLDHIAQYETCLKDIPEHMKHDIRKASVCKRLIDPSTCNQRCSMGYQFIMEGEVLKRCRNMAFMPTIQEGNQPFIKELLEHELTCRV